MPNMDGCGMAYINRVIIGLNNLCPVVVPTVFSQVDGR
jgi:hypothetical protein